MVRDLLAGSLNWLETCLQEELITSLLINVFNH